MEIIPDCFQFHMKKIPFFWIASFKKQKEHWPKTLKNIQKCPSILFVQKVKTFEFLNIWDSKWAERINGCQVKHEKQDFRVVSH